MKAVFVVTVDTGPAQLMIEGHDAKAGDEARQFERWLHASLVFGQRINSVTVEFEEPDAPPRVKTCPECRGRGGYDTRNPTALYSPPYRDGEWHTCGTCRGTGSVALAGAQA